MLCPLTIDLAYFRETLDAASLDSVTRGGSRIGDALRFALNNGFDDVRRGSKDLVLLTDGGDQDSDPQQAAQALARSGVRLSVIGMPGDRIAPLRSRRFPENSNQPFLYNGCAPVPDPAGDPASLRAMGGCNYWEANSAFDPGGGWRHLAARVCGVPAAQRARGGVLSAVAGSGGDTAGSGVSDIGAGPAWHKFA